MPAYYNIPQTGVVPPKFGSYLTDADQTINPGTDKASLYILPTQLTANRVLTLGTGGSPAATHFVVIRSYDTSAFTLTVKDDLAATLFTFTASSPGPRDAWFYFLPGGHWGYYSTFLYLSAS